MPAKRSSRDVHFPEVVRAYRAQVSRRILQLMGGRSQRAWARELNIPQQNISRYVSGDNVPHLDFLVHLGRREKVNLNWLVLGEGKMTRE